MGYPRHEKKFRTFVIEQVLDCGEYWEITASDGGAAFRYYKVHNFAAPKRGARCRIYEENGIVRGCYIAGRKHFFASSQQTRTLIRNTFAREGLRVASTTTKQRRTLTHK